VKNNEQLHWWYFATFRLPAQ